jgi:hypothetical protein
MAEPHLVPYVHWSLDEAQEFAGLARTEDSALRALGGERACRTFRSYRVLSGSKCTSSDFCKDERY